MTKCAITLIVSIFTYSFMIEEYNYQRIDAFVVAAIIGAIVFTILDFFDDFRKWVDERKWEKRRRESIMLIPAEEQKDEINVEDYEFLFSMTTNEDQ